MRLARRNEKNIEHLSNELQRYNERYWSLTKDVSRMSVTIASLEDRVKELERAAMPEFDRLLAEYEDAKERRDNAPGGFPSTARIDRFINARQALQAYCEANGCDDPTEDRDEND